MVIDRRSAEAAEYRKLYKTARWRHLRADHLQDHPLCERCAAEQLVTAATVVNHREPHRGDLVLFFDRTNLESSCAPHHDSTIKREENAGFHAAPDDDGWPSDPHHPANRTNHDRAARPRHR